MVSVSEQERQKASIGPGDDGVRALVPEEIINELPGYAIEKLSARDQAIVDRNIQKSGGGLYSSEQIRGSGRRTSKIQSSGRCRVGFTDNISARTNPGEAKIVSHI